MGLAVRWCNHPGKSADAAYKPGQLAAFRDCGLRVPPTLITNRADDVTDFARRVGQLVCKAIVSEVLHTAEGTNVVYTHLLADGDLADLQGVHHTAHLFQQRVPRAFEVRLTVVGNEFFAAKISSGAMTCTQVDWRRDYDSHTYEIIDTPEEIRSAVTVYMNRAGLAFGACDFVVTPDGEWIALSAIRKVSGAGSKKTPAFPSLMLSPDICSRERNSGEIPSWCDCRQRCAEPAGDPCR